MVPSYLVDSSASIVLMVLPIDSRIDGGWWLMQCTKFNGEICGPTIKSIENSLVKSMVQPGIKKNKI
jgi:hypothetical protein